MLRALAYDMMRERKGDITGTKVLERFENALQRVPGSQTAAEFLADVSSSGLLVERDPGLYCFAHQTLQEYLAAAHIRDKGWAYVLVGGSMMIGGEKPRCCSWRTPTLTRSSKPACPPAG